MREQWKPGEIIELGHYPQSRAGAREAIEWRILRVERETAFVTSIYALDAQPFDVSAGPFEETYISDAEPGQSGPATVRFSLGGYGDVTWEGSSLRAWLNQDFMETAFSAEEQRILMPVDDLQDKVSLLELDAHINDAELFPSDASTGCMVTPYAASLYEDDTEDTRQQGATRPLPPRASYWLKNKGAAIHGDGMEGVYGVVYFKIGLADKLAVRPTLMINLTRYEAWLAEGSCDSTRGGIFSQGNAIVHRFDESKQGRIRIDSRNHVITVDGFGHPDLHLDLPIQGQLDDQNAQAIATCLAMAIQGDAKAQNSIGSMFWNGHILTQDYAEAFKWNRYAANQGLPEAMLDLADAYFNELGTKRDVHRAFALCLEAAKKDYPLGMLSAGKCYANGWGTERNTEEALAWLNKAAQAGNTEAAELRDAILRQR